MTRHVAVVGAGIGGLAAALDLASRGVRVTVLEREALPGGKLRQQEVDGARIDAGPTVFTMRWVLDELFDAAGTSLADHLTLRPAEVLARHAWTDGSRLDLFADRRRSEDAIAAFAGPGEARRFGDFCDRAQRIWTALEHTFVRNTQTNPAGLVRRAGIGGFRGINEISPYATLWSTLSKQFKDPRLRQLFGRYATYCGSSPFLSPATLMLIAHVEQRGVWLVDGGMRRIPEALAAVARTKGAEIRYRAEVEDVLVDRRRATGLRLADGEVVEADAIVFNADTASLAAGHFGAAAARAVPPLQSGERSLSAVTWAIHGEVSGFPLSHHTVFFSSDYPAEFRQIFQHRCLPGEPTTYICAQDRGAQADAPAPHGPERLLCLVNAPPRGDIKGFEGTEIEQCEKTTFGLLARCGLTIGRMTATPVRTTPAEFNRLFPATGGALYGRASHGWRATFQRPGARSKIPGLYLAGGSVHPGPGVPMATLSGRTAARILLGDLVSRRR